MQRDDDGSSASVTRRALFGAAGAAAIGGALVGPGAAAGQEAGAGRFVELIGRLVQDGFRMTGFGYITHVTGIDDEALFAPGDARTEAQARLLFTAEATIGSRFQLETIFSAVATGRVDFRLATGGASFADPASFARGTRVASFGARLHNTLAVQAPDTAITFVEGELRQRTAERFRLGGRARRIGRRGQVHELAVSGNGVRSDAAVPRATFVVAGRIELAG
jgi:hypothetical protein